MTIKAWAAPEKGAALEPFEYETEKLKAHDVEIEIEYCGICHSDIHLIDNDWQFSSYPLVPGHEVVGRIRAKGAHVWHLEEGQRVGVGWHSKTCGECEFCSAGKEVFCPEQKATCVGRYGGFADAIRVNAGFAFPLPEGLDPASAGPLLCGGITVYTPLREFAGPSKRVGVIGIGGLGHMAIRFADAMGCEVTAFSTTPEKETEARELGADRFIVSKDDKAMESAVGSLDLIINTAFADLNWPQFLTLLRPEGRLHIVGVPPSPIAIPGFLLLTGNRSIGGSAVGHPHVIREMLGFAARHGITAQSEIMPMEKVNDALERVRAGDARYRVVLKNG